MAIEGIEETKQEDKQVLEMKSLTFATTTKPENKKFNHVTCMTSNAVEFI